MRLKTIALAMAGVSAFPVIATAQQAPAPHAEVPTADAPAPTEPDTRPLPDTSAPASGPGSGLTDIVVTAQRREENLQKVPVAVTALSAQKLDELRVINGQGLTGLAPGLQVLAQGRASTPTFVIRGIISGVASNSVDPKVGVYIDGVYIGRLIGSTFDIGDIQRIEVLRGPQGTLFGRNATAGAISITTATPTGKFGVRGSVSYGNYDAKRAKVSVNLPAFGPFSARVSYLHDDIEGDQTNLIGGQTVNLALRDPNLGKLTYARKLGSRNVDAVQAAVHGDFGAVTADYRFDYADARTVGRGVQSLGTPDNAAATLVKAIGAFQPLFGGNTNTSTGHLDAYANGITPERLVTQGHSLTLTASDPDNGITVKSISAFRKFKQYPNIYDFAAGGGYRFTAAQLGALLQGNIAGVLAPANAPGPNDSLNLLLIAQTLKQKQLTQEFQVLLTKDAFDLTAGVFIFHENSPTDGVTSTFQPIANGLALAIPAFDQIFGGGLSSSRAINDSFAGYAQGTLHVAPTFDITLGGRYTLDDRESQLYAITRITGSTLSPGTYKVRYEKFTYAAIATWRPTTDTTAYGKFSTGYVAGGIFNAIPYKPESLKTAEVGLKTQFFDNHVRTNIAAYYSWYDDLQRQNFLNGVALFENAGKAAFKGVELEVEAVPVEGLTVSGNFNFVDFKFKTFLGTDSLGVRRDIVDVATSVAMPKYSGRLSIQYDMAAFENGSHLFARIDGNYRSRIYIQSPLYQAPNPNNAAQVANAALLNALAHRPSLFLLNARVGLADWDIGGTKFALSAFGQNLTDKHPMSNGVAVLRLNAIRDRGRTYGVELGFDF